VLRGGQRKGMSAEVTFSTMTEEQDMVDKIHHLSESLSRDLESEKLQGKTVTIKLKTSDFQLITRSRTSDSYISKADQINSIAQAVLNMIYISF
jgi:nucleotidyltransferase/DNA polymerase involved in DNA repair